MTTPLRSFSTPEPQPGFTRFVAAACGLALLLLLAAPLAWTVRGSDPGPEVRARVVGVEVVPTPARSEHAEAERPESDPTEHSSTARSMSKADDFRLTLPSFGSLLGL